MKKNAPYLLIILVGVAVDQFVKSIIGQTIKLYESHVVIPGFFNLTRIHNKGAIFGFFSQSGNTVVFILLTLASFVALSLVVYYFIKTPPTERWMKISLALILTGALGNLTDRIVRGYVIDFLDFYIKDFHWPFFNVADSCITTGAFLILFLILFRSKSACSPSS